MTNPITLAKGWLRHAAAIRTEWADLPDLVDSYYEHPHDSAVRRCMGGAIADIYESVARHLDVSPPARAFAGVTAGQLRTDAPLWRSGEMSN